jgi:hypothetical protein
MSWEVLKSSSTLKYFSLAISDTDYCALPIFRRKWKSVELNVKWGLIGFVRCLRFFHRTLILSKSSLKFNNLWNNQ